MTYNKIDIKWIRYEIIDDLGNIDPIIIKRKVVTKEEAAQTLLDIIKAHPQGYFADVFEVYEWKDKNGDTYSVDFSVYKETGSQ